MQPVGILAEVVAVRAARAERGTEPAAADETAVAQRVAVVEAAAPVVAMAAEAEARVAEVAVVACSQGLPVGSWEAAAMAARAEVAKVGSRTRTGLCGHPTYSVSPTTRPRPSSGGSSRPQGPCSRCSRAHRHGQSRSS